MRGQSLSVQPDTTHLPLGTEASIQVNPHGLNHRLLQNVLLLWIDSNINLNLPGYKDSLIQLRGTVNEVALFTEVEACLRFLQGIHKEKVFIITSDEVGKTLIPKIHSMPVVLNIYVFSGDKLDDSESWIQKWPKVQGSYKSIETINQNLNIALKQSNENLMPISFVMNGDGKNSNEELNRLEPSFMYTTLLKRILLTMDHVADERETILKLCRTQYADNPRQLRRIEEFGRSYCSDKAIWWYTCDCFAYQILNRALRLLESDIIVDMGFFIYDLHQQLERLHREQFSEYEGDVLTLHRGQMFSLEEFTELRNSQGKLMAFNSFLSTTRLREVALRFSKHHAKMKSMVHVLFVIAADPKTTSTPFADIENYSFFREEKEILFSMHSIFRIGEIRPLSDENSLFEVHLRLTNDEDRILRQLADRIEEEVEAGNGWQRLANVLIKLGETKKAEELYLSLLEQQSNGRDQSRYHHHLGLIKYQQGNYQEAIRYYEKALSIQQKVLPATDLSLATSYNHLGRAYESMGDYSRAQSFYDKALVIREKLLPSEHPDLAQSYHNIGSIHLNTGEYAKALVFYTKALSIRDTALSPIHTHLATTYYDIGRVYKNISDYPKALSYFHKALDIDQKSLPGHHASLASTYDNIGGVHTHMKDYSQALTYYRKALQIFERSVHSNHPSLAASYNNIGAVHYQLKEYSTALTYFQKALSIWKRASPSEDAQLQNVIRWIELVEEKMKRPTDV